SFIREFSTDTIKAILLSFLCGILAHLIFIIVSRIMFRKGEINAKKVLQFALVFSNCSFMSLPLQEAVLGDTGVLYGGAFITIFNIFAWSYGIVLMSGDKKYLSAKKIIINPGILACVIGMIIFISQIKIPYVIYQPINYLAGLNTPLPMIIIGYHLANSDFIKGLKDKKALLAVAARLIILPLLAMGLFLLIGIKGDLLVSVIIFASAPTAAITTMFSAKFGGDTALSVNMVSVSTVLSLITMPLIITLAMSLA
ncbi:MAG: AEC family transporter, partial [Clostridia bacterium]|nr:AEC family transporter [Clostridia bacterium]